MATSDEARKAASERMKAMHERKREEKAQREREIGQLAQDAVGTTTRTQNDRPRRNLFNGTNQRLIVDGEIPGFHLHWFNDSPGRIEQALASGYQYVTEGEVRLTSSRRVTEANADMGTGISTVVNSDPAATFNKAVLMKIPMEYFEEDQKEAQNKISSDEESMIRNGGMGNLQNRYVPKTHVDGQALKITHRVR